MDKVGLKKYVEYLDPSFRITTRWKIKESGLPDLVKKVYEKIKLVIDKLSSVLLISYKTAGLIKDSLFYWIFIAS